MSTWRVCSLSFTNSTQCRKAQAEESLKEDATVLGQGREVALVQAMLLSLHSARSWPRISQLYFYNIIPLDSQPVVCCAFYHTATRDHSRMQILPC